MNTLTAKRGSVLVTIFTMVLLAGCVSSLSFPQPPGPDVDRSSFKEVSSSACGLQLFQLLPLGTMDRQERAFQELTAQSQGAHLGEIEMTEDWYYGVIGSVYCTSFKAKAYPKSKS